MFRKEVQLLSVRQVRRTLLALLVGFGSSAAFAQVNPPAWWNQSPNDQGTVSMCFNFDTNAFPPVASIRNVPSWFPSGDGSWTKTGAASWFAGPYGSHSGVWGIDGSNTSSSLEIQGANQTSPGDITRMWVQFDYLVSSTGQLGITYDSSPGSISNGFSSSSTNLETVPGVGTWVRNTVTWNVTVQPTYERVRWTMSALPGTASTVLVDNFCFGSHNEPVPEPATAVALGMGICSLLYVWRKTSRC